MLSYSWALALAYASALALWWLAARVRPQLWRDEPVAIAKPWRELAWTVPAVLAVIGIGQLYVRGWLLPADGALRVLAESLNQLAIFSPMLALLLLRRQPLRSAWIRTDRVYVRLLVGTALALAAIFVFTSVAHDARSWTSVVPRVYRIGNVPHAVQVLMEDVTIAILVVRFSAAIGNRAALVAVAALFAAGHVPAMLANGASAEELTGLLRDFALGLAVIGVARRSADVWWLWCVHFALDLMQFESGATLG